MKKAGTKSRQLKALRQRAEALLHVRPQGVRFIKGPSPNIPGQFPVHG